MTGDDMADDEIGESESGSSPLGPEGPRPGAEGEDRGRPGSAAGGRPGAGRLDVIGFRLEPDRDHDGSPARPGLTDLFACRRPRRAGAHVPPTRRVFRLGSLDRAARQGRI